MTATISLGSPGIAGKDQLPAAPKTLTQAIMGDSYPASSWTHVYTHGSAQEATHSRGSGVTITFVNGDTIA